MGFDTICTFRWGIALRETAQVTQSCQTAGEQDINTFLRYYPRFSAKDNSRGKQKNRLMKEGRGGTREASGKGERINRQTGQDGAALGGASRTPRLAGTAWLMGPPVCPKKMETEGHTLCSRTSLPAPMVPFPLTRGLTGFPTHLYANHRLTHRERHFVPSIPGTAAPLPGASRAGPSPSGQTHRGALDTATPTKAWHTFRQRPHVLPVPQPGSAVKC